MFTGIVLHYLLKELDSLLNRRIRDVRRSENRVSINFERKAITANLNPNYSHLSLERIKGEVFFPSFFKGERVKEIKQIGLDRLLIIETSGGLKIVFEFFGRRADCLFLKEDKIIYSYKGIKRGIYEIPESPSGLNILKADKEELIDAILQGSKIQGLSVSFINGLRGKGREVVEDFCERKYQPTVFSDILSPFALSVGRKFPWMNEAVVHYFKERRKLDQKEEKRDEILHFLERKIRKVRKTLEELLSNEDFSIYRLKGEALLTHKSRIEPDKKEVELQYLDRELQILLNPNLSLQENAQRYFQLYKKGKKKAEVAKRKRKNLERELLGLEKKREKVKSAGNLEEFEKESIVRKEEKKIKGVPHKVREFTTKNGYKVLVGKGAESNHELTFSYARPYDVFLHVKNAPGSHTILRLKDKNKSPPMEDIQEAAFYAARFSKLKNTSIVPVSYTEKKYVRSSKRFPVGKVILEREKIIYIRLK